MTDVDKVISVCSAKHLAVWSVAANQITKFIDAKEYVVIVPEREISQFKQSTPQKIDVISEKAYTNSVQDTLKSKIHSGKEDRYGWYLQQFIKLAALVEAKPNETYLIWDADTVPLKPLTFTSGSQLRYYKSAEHHLPYFKTIDRLLELEKIVNHSFITQCFPIKGAWMHGFINLIESKHQIPWFEAIVDSIGFQKGSSFSEYETLGTFLSHRYASAMFFTDKKWLRSANSLIGGVQNIDNPIAKHILKDFDYAAFELWDKDSKNRAMITRGLRHLVRRVIGK